METLQQLVTAAGGCSVSDYGTYFLLETKTDWRTFDKAGNPLDLSINDRPAYHRSIKGTNNRYTVAGQPVPMAK